MDYADHSDDELTGVAATRETKTAGLSVDELNKLLSAYASQPRKILVSRVMVDGGGVELLGRAPEERAPEEVQRPFWTAHKWLGKGLKYTDGRYVVDATAGAADA